MPKFGRWRLVRNQTDIGCMQCHGPIRKRESDGKWAHLFQYADSHAVIPAQVQTIEKVRYRKLSG